MNCATGKCVSEWVRFWWMVPPCMCRPPTRCYERCV